MQKEEEGEHWNDGTPVEGAWPAADGTVMPGGYPSQAPYGKEWQEALFTAEDVLQSLPEAEFLEKVVGETGGSMRDVLNMDTVDRVVSKANESAWRATRMAERLQEQWDLFDTFDDVMVDFGVDREGAAYVRDTVARRGFELVTARMVQEMIKARQRYGVTLAKISTTGAIEVGGGAQDVLEFHQGVGVMIDTTHWLFDTFPGEFGEIHQRFVDEMASGHFAVAAHKWLEARDPYLLPAFLRLVRGASKASRYYRALMERKGVADIGEEPEDRARIDRYLFLMAVLDMSWQIVMGVRNETGAMYTDPESPGVAIITEGGAERDELADPEELRLTPKRVWYRWFVQVLEKIGAVGRRESLSEAIDRRVIQLGADPIEDEDEAVVPEYPFHKLHYLANRYSESVGWRLGTDRRLDEELGAVGGAIRGADLDIGIMAYTKWVNETPERKRVLFELTRNLEKLADVFPANGMAGGRGFRGKKVKSSSVPSMESGTPTMLESQGSDIPEPTTTTTTTIGGEIPPEHRGHHRFVSIPIREMEELIGALHGVIAEVGRLQETHRKMRGTIESVLGDALRGGRGDPEWILQPQFTGRIKKTPPVVAGINSAINEIRTELPRLAPRTISDPEVIHRALSTTPFLSHMYAKLVAYHMQQGASLFQRTMLLDKTYARGRRVRLEILKDMSSWLWGNPPHDTGRPYEAARGRDSGSMRHAGGRVRIRSIPPAIPPTDPRYKEATAKRRRTIEPISTRFPGSGRSRSTTRDIASHIVRRWDEEYIRRRILDHVAANAVGL